MGFVGGSDCYTGRPGDDHPGHQLRRYQKAGLTGLYATDLSLEAVLAAMKARRVYATSGVRIVAAVAADGNLMGAEYSTKQAAHDHRQGDRDRTAGTGGAIPRARPRTH